MAERTYTLTRDDFRAAHPEIAARSWIEDGRICFHNRLSGRIERIALNVPLCDGCDLPVEECTCLTEAVQGDPLARKAA